jgi:hypothetical protein
MNTGVCNFIGRRLIPAAIVSGLPETVPALALVARAIEEPHY